MPEIAEHNCITYQDACRLVQYIAGHPQIPFRTESFCGAKAEAMLGIMVTEAQLPTNVVGRIVNYLPDMSEPNRKAFYASSTAVNLSPESGNKSFLTRKAAIETTSLPIKLEVCDTHVVYDGCNITPATDASYETYDVRLQDNSIRERVGVGGAKYDNHIAATVWVLEKETGIMKQMVIDPAFNSERPIEIDEWKEIQQNAESVVSTGQLGGNLFPHYDSMSNESKIKFRELLSQHNGNNPVADDEVNQFTSGLDGPTRNKIAASFYNVGPGDRFHYVITQRYSDEPDWHYPTHVVDGKMRNLLEFLRPLCAFQSFIEHTDMLLAEREVGTTHSYADKIGRDRLTHQANWTEHPRIGNGYRAQIGPDLPS